MRPQDVAILLKMILIDEKNWFVSNLANSLLISQSEVSEALNRNYIAGLVSYDKKRVNRQSFMEFLQYGLHYVFPQQPGPIVNGVVTAHSHPYMKNYFFSEQQYVWPDFKGNERGQLIEPLYSKQVEAIKQDAELYKLFALVDVIRVGRRREIDLAVHELAKIILHES